MYTTKGGLGSWPGKRQKPDRRESGVIWKRSSFDEADLFAGKVLCHLCGSRVAADKFRRQAGRDPRDQHEPDPAKLRFCLIQPSFHRAGRGNRTF